MAPGIKTSILPHTYTEHRPHAAPKGQEETLIRVREDSSESETASVGAEEPEQARPSWALKGLTSAPPAQALYPDRQALGPLSWEGVGGTAGGPARQSCIQPLFPTGAEAVFRQNSERQ